MTRSVNDRLDALERRLDAIERGGVWAEPVPNQNPTPELPSCRKCGVAFSKTMGYVCPYADCPTAISTTTRFKAGSI